MNTRYLQGNKSIKTGRNHLLWFLFFTVLFFPKYASSQLFQVNGSASSKGGGCYELTPNAPGQLGSVWSPNTVSLKNSFVVSGRINFGVPFFNAGADGIAFAIQQSGNNLGKPGAGLGVGSVNPSLVVEFDTYKNGWDPNYDHAAITWNGESDHANFPSLDGPVQIVAGKNNIKDGNWYNVRFEWDAPNQTFTVQVECQTILTYQGNMIQQIFRGYPDVYWGFSSSTGNKFNQHQVCIDATTLFEIDDQKICKGDTATITLPSLGNSYSLNSWTPTSGIINAAAPNPTFSPDVTTDYIITYKDYCNNETKDTFKITVDPTPIVDLGNDTNLCGTGSLTLDAKNIGASYSWNNNAVTQTINTSIGTHHVEVTNANGCIDRDTITISPSGNLSLDLGKDTTFCGKINLNLDAGNPGASYLCNTGATSKTLYFTAAGTYDVIVTAPSGCIGKDTIVVSPGNDLSVDLGKDTTFCGNINLNLDAGNLGASYLWNTGATSKTLNITAAGTYDVIVTAPSGCIGKDTILISSESIDLGNDTNFCDGASILLDAIHPGANILWSTGATSQTIAVRSLGTYYVDVTTSAGCSINDTVKIIVSSCTEINYILPDTIYICEGDSAEIIATGVQSPSWTGTSTYSSVNDTTIKVSPTGTSKYYVSKLVKGPSIIANGDFENGGAGFTSQYFENCNSLYNAGQYCVTNFVPSTHPNFSDCLDHTEGSKDKMMVVNGASAPNTEVWCQTITTGINKDYEFSAWLTSVHPDNPATLQFEVNGILIGNPISPSGIPCDWNNYAAQWNSGASTSSKICLLNQNTGNAGNDFAIDDIKFVPLHNTRDSVVVLVNKKPTVNLGKDTSICSNIDINFSINAANNGATYAWNDGSTNQSLNVSDTGTYIVQVTNTDKCVNNDTLLVTPFVIPVVDLGNDTSSCQQINFMVDASNIGSNFQWSTGATSQTINILSTGIYFVDVTDGNNCTVRDSIIVDEKTNSLQADLGPDSTFCGPINYTRNIGNPGNTYLWNTGSTNQSINITTPGKYWARVTDNAGCTKTDTIQIKQGAPVTVDLGNDQSICNRSEITLDAKNTGASFLWNTGATTTSILVDAPGTYDVTVTNTDNCKGKDVVVVARAKSPVIKMDYKSIACEGDLVSIATGNTIDSHTWSNGLTSNTATISNQHDNLSVIVTNADGCDTTGYASVKFENITVSLDEKFYHCSGETLIISPNNIAPSYKYIWNSTGTDLGNGSLSVNSDGTHEIEAMMDIGYKFCSTTKTTELLSVAYPTLTIKGDSAACEGETIELEMLSNGTVSWNDRTTENPLTVTSSGNYGATASISSNNITCEIRKVKNVQFYEYPTLEETPTLKHCFNYDKQLTLFTNTTGQYYLWLKDSSRIPITSVPGEGSYTVEIYNHEDCRVSQEIVVEEKCPLSLYVPNAFSPNKDGINDEFYVVGNNAETFEFYIYNRWGELIFKSTDNNSRWDGSFQGEPAQQDVYVWKAILTGVDSDLKTKSIQQTGTVTLIR